MFILTLLRRLTALAPGVRFILLTHACSHGELAELDGPNLSRCMVAGKSVTGTCHSNLIPLFNRLLQRVPDRFRGRFIQLGYRGHVILKRGPSAGILQELGADLLFCPFTAPTFFDPVIPAVCVIYDIQYKIYPDFFDPADAGNREHTFMEACRRSAVLVAISDYTRQTVIQYGRVDPARIRTVYIRMATRFTAPPGGNRDLLARLDLEPGRYLIYPANFWRHKNHEMLLTAFNMACHAGLEPDIKLVCTGESCRRQSCLIQAAAAMGIGHRVIFPGYLPDSDLSSLLSGAGGLIFPSLYEGFGMPVVEAMAAGIPVACSNLTSLPEIAGNGAVLFDPRIPQEMADAMVMLTGQGSVRTKLIQAGHRRAAEFMDSDRMAREYLSVFSDAVNSGRRK